MYADQKYKECDGIYLVIRGYCDILSQKDNQKLHELQTFDYFGDAKFIQEPSYEYMGDIYAGLYPKNFLKLHDLKQNAIKSFSDPHSLNNKNIGQFDSLKLMKEEANMEVRAKDVTQLYSKVSRKQAIKR